jgi:hypothetical protein
MKQIHLRIALAAAMLLGASVTTMFGQCDTTARRIQTTLSPSSVRAGTVVQFVGSDIPQVSPVRLKAFIDDVPAQIVNATRGAISIRVPEQSTGEHKVWFCIDDGPSAVGVITVRASQRELDTAIDRTDPDPRTNVGPRQDLSDVNRRPMRDDVRTYPGGGHGGTLPCTERHIIDGTFSTLSDDSREWSGIPPMIGRFSHMYLDYCSSDSAMYLVNDWLIGTGIYRDNCYNLFDFTTGNGKEHWRIKVTHDTVRPMIVVLNGVDVTDDTTLVLGGRFGIGASPSDTTPHTIYEFGVRVTAGLFMLPNGSDPVEYRPATGVGLDCDQSIVEGYGNVQEPWIRSAVFDDDGVSVRQDERYIPIGGVVGLETEPRIATGETRGDTIVYRSGNGPQVRNICNGRGVVDGILTPEEWIGNRPINGVYSDLYAQYCGGRLQVLNDWVLADAMPDNASCYNLFDLFTGSGAEHWGIWVFQDITRKPRVFRNGVEVTDDTTIVKAGKAGWGTSPRLAREHAMYEFEIVAMEGGFSLQYADPGPASFCTITSSTNDDRTDVPSGIVQPQPWNPSMGPVTITGITGDCTIDLVDLRGSSIYSTTAHASGSLVLDVPTTIASGHYTLRVRIDNKRVEQYPLIIHP